MDNNKRTRSAAALMVLLGEDMAASVMRHLDEDEVERLSRAIHKIEGQEAEYVDSLGTLLDASELSE